MFECFSTFALIKKIRHSSEHSLGPSEAGALNHSKGSLWGTIPAAKLPGRLHVFCSRTSSAERHVSGSGSVPEPPCNLCGNGILKEFSSSFLPCDCEIDCDCLLHSGANHRVLQGAPPRGRQLYFTFPSAPDPLFKASKAPFLTLRVATPSGAPRQAPLEQTLNLQCWGR